MFATHILKLLLCKHVNVLYAPRKCLILVQAFFLVCVFVVFALIGIEYDVNAAITFQAFF